MSAFQKQLRSRPPLHSPPCHSFSPQPCPRLALPEHVGLEHPLSLLARRAITVGAIRLVISHVGTCDIPSAVVETVSYTVPGTALPMFASHRFS